MGKQDDETKRAIIDMLQENTGRHFLDSGGAYGRHWEINQKLPSDIDFWNTAVPFVFKAKDYKGELEFQVTKSLYYHLDDALIYDKRMTELYWRWDSLFPDAYWNETMESFTKIKGKRHNFHMGEIGDGYTYNEENYLSQDFIWHHFVNEVDGEEYCFIQIHGGCDARGGFTRPRIFQFREEPYNLLEISRYTVSCENRHYWDFEAIGYHEYTEQEIKLNEAEHILYEDMDEEEQKAFDNGGTQIVAEEQSTFLDVRKFIPYDPKGKIIVKDDNAFCPICAKQLDAYTF